jgi:hypothetical protein
VFDPRRSSTDRAAWEACAGGRRRDQPGDAQGLTEISARHDVRLPAELALTGKALAQMQLAASVLDPDLDPFSVVGGFLRRRLFEQGRGVIDPKRAFYEAQKIKVRLSGLISAVERLVGARPGQRFQVDLKGTGGLEDTIRRAARRVALAVVAGSAIVASGFTAGSGEVGVWLPLLFACIGGVMVVLLLFDLFWRRN